jgi:hypothetical protein
MSCMLIIRRAATRAPPTRRSSPIWPARSGWSRPAAHESRSTRHSMPTSVPRFRPIHPLAIERFDWRCTATRRRRINCKACCWLIMPTIRLRQCCFGCCAGRDTRRWQASPRRRTSPACCFIGRCFASGVARCVSTLFRSISRGVRTPATKQASTRATACERRWPAATTCAHRYWMLPIVPGGCRRG